MSETKRTTSRGDILAIGFGTTVGMWAVAYVCRFPAVVAPEPVLLVGLLVCVLAGGFVAGRYARRGWRGGPYVGLLSAMLNMLILGSLLSGSQPNRIIPSALWWIPGALLIGAVLGVVGGAIGQVFRRAGQGEPNWTGVFALVAVAATLLLLIAGGLVTSAREGLAVVDWPNSFGYNMFLYPLSRMTGGIYYEHAHRLFGSLVGLTMLVLAVYLWRTDDRAWVRRFTLVTFAMVCVQGLLGGLRVTGRLTISTSPQDMAPSLALAVVHGVLGQVVFGLIVALAVFTSRTWQSDRRAETRITAGADRGLSIVLVVLLVVQLVVGAIQRHFLHGLITHITLGVFVVVAVVATGARAWGLYSELSMLRRLGCTLLLLTGVQVILGILALVAISFSPASGAASPIDVAITTVHQAVGAVLLACAVSLMLWYYRLVQPVVAVNATPSSHAVSQ